MFGPACCSSSAARWRALATLWGVAPSMQAVKNCNSGMSRSLASAWTYLVGPPPSDSAPEAKAWSASPSPSGENSLQGGGPPGTAQPRQKADEEAGLAGVIRAGYEDGGHFRHFSTVKPLLPINGPFSNVFQLQ